MTNNNSKLFNAISISCENDNLPSSCSVEINLSPSSPTAEERRVRDGSPASNNSGHENAFHQQQEIGSGGSASTFYTEASIESRNDHEILTPLSSPLAAAVGGGGASHVPASIFRTTSDPMSAPATTTTTTAGTTTDSCATSLTASPSRNHQQILAQDRRKSVNDTSDGAPGFREDSGSSGPAASDRPGFYGSVSYDNLFEVQKAQSNHHGVTLVAGENAKSINLLYDELRSMTLNPNPPDDDALENDSFVATSPCSNMQSALAKRVALQTRADELILEARKACSFSSHLSQSNSSLEEAPKADAKRNNNNKDFFHQRIKRTQSLDRVLSTKEVLELATQALERRQEAKNSFTVEIDDGIATAEETESTSSNGTMNTPTHEQETMLGRQAEKGTCISPEDAKVKDTLQRIQAQHLEQQALQDPGSPSSKEKAPEDLEGLTSDDPKVSRDKALKRLDGIVDKASPDLSMTGTGTLSRLEPNTNHSNRKQPTPFSIMKFLWGGDDEDGEVGGKGILACGPITRRHLRAELHEKGMGPYENKFASMATSLMRRNHEHLPSFAETAANKLKTDPRMRDWIDGQFAPKEELPNDGTYLVGKSRTVVVHEIVRGNWTWCTAWSPDGSRLAIATENHHLAIVDTSTSVWRVRHDKRIVGPVRNDTTHSIRSIAWGSHFIAIGGTGNAVSILAPSEPFPILHTIKGVGFVGSLDWRLDSTVLAIGSRVNKAMLVKIHHVETGTTTGRQLQSEVLHTIPRKNWVNAVAFSPGGGFFAVGDAGGQLSIFRYDERPNTSAQVTPVASFTCEDSILAISFSPDGRWLYSGGEDFKLTCIDTNHWEIVHRLRRNRWVQCVASSRGGTHVAVGGVTSEVSILEVGLGWDTVINIELKGLVPLSASWHPRDQYLALTGQNQSILVVETTDSRHVSGHFLRSISPILAVEFSPDGRMAVIGNEQGIVTFYKLQLGCFVTVYEMVVTIRDSLCIRWSQDGSIIVIGTHDVLLVVGRSEFTEIRPNRPANASGFSIRKVIRGLGSIKSVALDFRSQFIVTSGAETRIFDIALDYRCIRSFDDPDLEANAWSPDGRWMATVGQSKTLTIYETVGDCGKWRSVVSLEGTDAGLAIAFGPITVGGLVYLAFGGEDKFITVVEIRTREGTWETVLRAQRDGVVHALDWNSEGLLAAAIGNGTVSVMDMSYLQCGLAVNEMDYKAQRQALTCFTEIRRNRGRNCMRAVRWIPSAPGSQSMLAVGGSDGEVEVVDLTSRGTSC